MIKFDKDENLILEVRRHWFVFIIPTAVSLIFAIVPVFLFSFLETLLKFEITAKYTWLLLGLYGLWLLVIWVVYFIEWTDYYLDVWYVTDKQIYDVLQNGFFHREVSILRFDNIQDITVNIRGIIPTVFDYGQIHVQTAGDTSADFTLKDAKHPNKVKDMLADLHSKAKKGTVLE
ncbi:MAG: PH domain-containing protein [Candidatus Pacebacteria bacterium]|nr:PH domain-containing protein [Candidatus Paceibacterota bacterium]